MARKKVVWTETAARQRNSILEYWVEHNKSNTYSLKLLELSNHKTKLIAKNPEMYRKSEYPDTRVASLGHFSIHYKIKRDKIIVTGFWDNRQDPKKLLKLLRKT
jgi:plasmid stabilization system protein ParE